MPCRDPIWSKRDLAKLKEAYEGGISIPLIAITLNRSVSAIKTRAQLNQFRRPRCFGKKQIEELQQRAKELQLDVLKLPANPTALQILCGVGHCEVIDTKKLLARCGIKDSSRNRAINLLRSEDLVFVDELASPRTLVLTQKAYRNRPPAPINEMSLMRKGRYIRTDSFSRLIEPWLARVCENDESKERYHAFIDLQYSYVRSGDVEVGVFLTILR